jgi:F-type H+-transporting ATPase subunit a
MSENNTVNTFSVSSLLAAVLALIVGFAWNLMSCTGILFLISFVPLLILIPLFGLELGVAVIQGFVFSILI